MLVEAVKSYLAVRRAFGFAYLRVGSRLAGFIRFASERGDTCVRAQTAIDWAGSTPSSEERSRRLKTVARFARHAHAEDDRHEIPPDDIFYHPRRRQVPYILAPEDIERLVAEAGRLKPEGSLRPLTYSALLQLLAATGLRIGEALRLRMPDLTTDGLVIRETKFRKSRLVPLHDTAASGIERYLTQRLAQGGEDDHIFLNQCGKPLRYDSAGEVFRQLARKLGLRRGPTQPKPRLHSLRHSFAVRALLSCPNQRDAIGQHMLALTTYLGHGSVADTYWYLEAIPELLADISKTCEAFRQGASR